MKEVETFKAKRIKIETDPAKSLTPDGQLMGSTPIEIECMHEAIKVFQKYRKFLEMFNFLRVFETLWLCFSHNLITYFL